MLRPKASNPAHSSARASKRENKRAEIIRAAYEEIAAVGFEGIRTRTLARRIGMDHATLHHYFSGKTEILRGVMNYIVDDRAIGQYEPTEDFDNEWFAHVESLLGEMEREPETFLVLAEVALRALRNSDARDVKGKFDSQWRAFIARRVESAIKSGTFRSDLDPQVAAELTMSLVRGAYFTFDGDAERCRPLFRHLLESFRARQERN